MKIVHISDTHMQGPNVVLPKGDILIHSGDHTISGQESQMRKAFKWLSEQKDKFDHILTIAGNHDFYLDICSPDDFHGWDLRRETPKNEFLKEFPDITYLQDEEIIINGIKFYGSPWTPYFGGWAFNFSRGHDTTEAKMTWDDIPDDVNVLITHGPPYGILDKVYSAGSKVGCSLLYNRIMQLSELRYHLFGHIHEAYGRLDYRSEDNERELSFINSSTCDMSYMPTNLPFIIEM